MDSGLARKGARPGMTQPGDSSLRLGYNPPLQVKRPSPHVKFGARGEGT
jgi:hypothetical protein